MHFGSEMKDAKRALRLATSVLRIVRFLQELNIVEITGVEIQEKRVRFILCLAQTEACICWILAEEALLSEAA